MLHMIISINNTINTEVINKLSEYEKGEFQNLNVIEYHYSKEAMKLNISLFRSILNNFGYYYDIINNKMAYDLYVHLRIVYYTFRTILNLVTFLVYKDSRNIKIMELGGLFQYIMMKDYDFDKIEKLYEACKMSIPNASTMSLN